MEKYVGIIGDIVGSRKLENRAEVQAKLNKLLDRVNDTYSSFIASKFLITIGDEFQGLLYPSAPIYEIISLITDSIYPVQFRFGVGYGSITTSIEEKAIGMDGPAFYSAREAISIAGNRIGHSIAFRSSILRRVEVDAINTTFHSLSVIRKLWKDNFFKVLTLLREGKTQTEIANELKITQPYVSKLMKNAYWVEVEELEKKIGSLLKCYLTGDDYV